MELAPSYLISAHLEPVAAEAESYYLFWNLMVMGRALLCSAALSLCARAARPTTTATTKSVAAASAATACRSLSTAPASSDKAYGSFQKKVEGELGKKGFSITYADAGSGDTVSPWHDIPLQPGAKGDGTYTFICELENLEAGIGTGWEGETNRRTGRVVVVVVTRDEVSVEVCGRIAQHAPRPRPAQHFPHAAFRAVPHPDQARSQSTLGTRWRFRLSSRATRSCRTRRRAS